MSARCLANLVEAIPNSRLVLVQLGAVPILVNRLLSVEYIDLAEQV
jgi:E3 ubiquitin-protein ligase TRIP12